MFFIFQVFAGDGVKPESMLIIVDPEKLTISPAILGGKYSLQRSLIVDSVLTVKVNVAPPVLGAS